MALSADYRVMVGNSVVPTKAKFGLNESSLGMNPPAWLRGLTASVIGTRNAEWHLGNSIMSTPEEALQIGFVDALAKDSDELLQLALDRGMATLLAIPPEARALCKQGYRMPIAELADTSESADPMVKSVFGDECQGMIKAMRSKMRGK
ncbi:hypothetical protein SARC_10901 [Sphaeroforma arctica JP610]|uniref:Enoyl-CoA hydratase n=1 Tax=Sphaeroforma arctica JP610 TaxID=667725 RepID=A0A0L0FIN6_9EUKA|nr:hypothetical protein SARC_10901 [Sphaeroforma arctica JP610]KNC76605.1 hypothetical protein SARC_10901 [Sphaeroforma arctica JP610]|eukprot:XP_014150507.1 hypothetical protein SARC_10901 [Sphaeroforma arctica JP610]